MAIQRDIPIDVSAEEVMKALSRGKRDAAWMAEPAREALKRATHLFAPVIVYEWAVVEGVQEEHVRVAIPDTGRSADLHVGPHANLMAKAKAALVSVNSIGQPLDDAVHELNASGEALGAYLLDCVGVVALSKVADAAAAMAEERAAAEGWGVGARLAPGSLVGWNTDRQSEICALLPLESAGLSLTDSGLIIPFKSASGMIGLGPDFKRKKVGSVCGLCSLKETCWRRRY